MERKLSDIQNTLIDRWLMIRALDNKELKSLHKYEMRLFSMLEDKRKIAREKKEYPPTISPMEHWFCYGIEYISLKSRQKNYKKFENREDRINSLERKKQEITNLVLTAMKNPEMIDTYYDISLIHKIDDLVYNNIKEEKHYNGDEDILKRAGIL